MFWKKKKSFLGYVVIDQFGNSKICQDENELVSVCDRMSAEKHTFKVYGCLLSVVDGKAVASV